MKGGIFMKKVLTMILFITLLFTSIGNGVALAKEKKTITKEEFLNLVYENKYYKTYINSIINKKPKTFKETTDSDGKVNGYLLEYEISYNNNNKNLLKQHSILAFQYYLASNNIDSFIIDYSKLESTYSVKIIELDKTNQSETISVKDKPYFTNYIDNVNKDVDNTKKTLSTTRGAELTATAYCWICTQEKTIPSTLDSDCAYWVGGACNIAMSGMAKKAAKIIKKAIPFAQLAVCHGATLVLCEIPGYTICTEGHYSHTCPMES